VKGSCRDAIEIHLFGKRWMASQTILHLNTDLVVDDSRTEMVGLTCGSAVALAMPQHA
jgi:hypothetical protein